MPLQEPLDQLADAALMQLVAQHNAVALQVLYHRYARPLYVLAAYRLSQTDAEEIVQETFLRLWRHADQYDATRGSVHAWVFTIARHRILDEHHRQRHQAPLASAEEIEHALLNAVDPSVDVEHHVWQREQAAVVLKAVRHLPVAQRQVLLLAYFGGLSQTAIAAVLGVPLGTVKKRTRLGLQKLRAALQAQALLAEITE
jgi:RNA polymerase sigma-70 factor (ECF subfamily)